MDAGGREGGRPAVAGGVAEDAGAEAVGAEASGGAEAVGAEATGADGSVEGTIAGVMSGGGRGAIAGSGTGALSRGDTAAGASPPGAVDRPGAKVRQARRPPATIAIAPRAARTKGSAVPREVRATGALRTAVATPAGRAGCGPLPAPT